MDEDGGVRVPVTRRRMRLSVEQSDEVKSSPAANTPTKRGGRRAAKPELDLIEENATENMTPKKTTKKTAQREIELAEEKPVTPSRRSTRIKSNTSIVSETTQGPDTPRAKRAARRTSQVGSDSEAPLTPARQTRRTRKDSTQNVEQAEPQPPVKQITEMILEEEAESTVQKSPKSPRKSMKQGSSPSALRQSPRLSLKNNINNHTIESKDESKNSDKNDSEEHNTSNKENEVNTQKEVVKIMTPNKENEANPEKEVVKMMTPDNKENVVSAKEKINQDNLSESNSELLNNLKTKPKKSIKNLNKSTSAIVDTPNFISKRHRTKSWTTVSMPVLNDNNFFSDSETVKKKRKSLLSDSRNDDLLSTSQDKKLSLSLKRKNKNMQDDSVVQIETGKDISASQEKTVSNEADGLHTVMESFFAAEPSDTMKTTVYIEECNSVKLHTDKNDDDDQCVPKVLESPIDRQDVSIQKENQCSFNFITSNQEKSMCNKTDFVNESCEPMDVDVTLPDNVNVLQQKLETTPIIKLNSKDSEMESSVNEESKTRKSSVSMKIDESSPQILEKTSNENKSTLVLSELKDISNENDVMQSPQICSKNNSKSDHALDVTKEDKGREEKNILSNYSTSTPLQQKGLNRLALQVNTSGITSNNSSKIEKSSKKNESKTSNKSNKSSDESLSDEESDSEQEKSKFIDDEAEEASDDYESGDSKDEEEERYERENEILHKGETLSTEDESSNDTDYEKDSFVVSSNEEDEDLLDGSGDDLSMSDNELKMTAKSKKKYNERKMKEQKNASREMFESRHKLNKSNDSVKSQASKGKKKQIFFESSDEEDIQIKTKKNNKMRLDSSHETSENKSLDSNTIMQKNKNVSINNESGINEKEMTIIGESANEEVDPLSIDIKKELVTPQKSKSNDSIKFINTEHLDENEDDKNISIKNARDDPLVDSNASDSSDSSDNVHIQNYDSILSELNKNSKSKKIKHGDTSLNLDKKIKKTPMPIVDELNLTQTKPKKLKKKQDKDEVDSKKMKSSDDNSASKPKSNIINSDNETSNSIDLHLLFSEDSNSSDNQLSSNKNKNDNSFIPLKQTPGKTNILEGFETNNTSTVDSAKKKNKKNKSLNKSSNDHKNDDNDMEVQFFVDTTGTYGSTEVQKSQVRDSKEEVENSDSDAPVEISNKSALEKESQRIDTEEEINKTVTSLNKSITKTPKSEKKKKRISESSIVEQTADNLLNQSSAKTPKSEKKKKKKLSESQSVEETNESVIAPEITTNKNARDQSILQDTKEDNIDTGLADNSLNKSIAKTPKSEKKKKKRLSESQTIEQTNEPDINSATTHATDPTTAEESVLQDTNEQNISISKTPKSEKKKKKSLSESNTAEPVLNDVTTDKDSSILLSSSKKQKSGTTEESNIKCTGDSVVQPNDNSNNAKKNKKKLSLNKSETSQEKDNIAESLEQKIPSSKKRKRQSSLSQVEVDQEDSRVDTTSKTLNDSINTSKIRSKKRKVCHNTENVESDNEDQLIHKETPAVGKKQRKNMENAKEKQPLQNNNNTKDIRQPDNLGKKKENKKRKEREDDEDHKVAKVLKANSFDKINVPRLPANILSQLEEKPKKKNNESVTKSKAISTSDFTVEETKILKTKPSNYLEESVYLNEDDDDTTMSKKQKRIKTPKVLPFLPTVSTSNSGCTTNFKVNIIPKEFKFVATSSIVSNFKNEYLENKKLKRLGTFELYKRSRNVKLSKF